MIENNQHFVELALRTESNNFPAIRERLLDRATHIAVIALLGKIGEQISYLDGVKKFLFYGKPSAYIDEFKKLYHEKNEGSVLPEITDDLLDDKTIRNLHGVVGITTESGELIEALLKRFFTGLEIDSVNMMEEAGGDVPWYQAILADANGYTFDQGQEAVIKKLQARFPDKFTEGHAINRNLETERNVLEQGYNKN